MDHQPAGARTWCWKRGFLRRGWSQADLQRRNRLEPGLLQRARRLRDAVCRLWKWRKRNSVRRALEPDYHEWQCSYAEQLRSHGHHFGATIRISGQRRAQTFFARESTQHWGTLSMRTIGSAVHPNARLPGFSLIQLAVVHALAPP